jgi:plastocyanin
LPSFADLRLQDSKLRRQAQVFRERSLNSPKLRRKRKIMRKPGSSLILGAFVVLLAFTPAFATNWHAAVGAQSPDKGRQALAFLPNEMWIHAGDTITWKFHADDIHTVTFLKAGQVRPPFPVGCPGFSASGATFDGSTCLSTPPLVSPAWCMRT